MTVDIQLMNLSLNTLCSTFFISYSCNIIFILLINKINVEFMSAIGITSPEQVNKTKSILNFKKRKKKTIWVTRAYSTSD